MAKRETRKAKGRRVPTVTQHIERAERARLRGQVKHNQEMRALARRLKAGVQHTDLALQGLVRELAPRLGLTVIDRVQWERSVAHNRDLQDRLEEAKRETRELREVRHAETE